MINAHDKYLLKRFLFIVHYFLLDTALVFTFSLPIILERPEGDRKSSVVIY